MQYRGHTIAQDGDVAIIYLPDANDYGTDPIEIVGGIDEAKATVDSLIREVTAQNGHGHDDEFDGYPPRDPGRERFGSDY